MDWIHRVFPPRVLTVVEGTLLAAAGAALTYLTAAVSGADLGQWTPVVAAAWMAFANAARHWLASKQPPPNEPPYNVMS